MSDCEYTSFICECANVNKHGMQVKCRATTRRKLEDLSSHSCGFAGSSTVFKKSKKTESIVGAFDTMLAHNKLDKSSQCHWVTLDLARVLMDTASYSLDTAGITGW